jgi:hypothetical protein
MDRDRRSVSVASWRWSRPSRHGVNARVTPRDVTQYFSSSASKPMRCCGDVGPDGHGHRCPYPVRAAPDPHGGSRRTGRATQTTSMDRSMASVIPQVADDHRPLRPQCPANTRVACRSRRAVTPSRYTARKSGTKGSKFRSEAGASHGIATGTSHTVPRCATRPLATVSRAVGMAVLAYFDRAVEKCAGRPYCWSRGVHGVDQQMGQGRAEASAVTTRPVAARRVVSYLDTTRQSRAGRSAFAVDEIGAARP